MGLFLSVPDILQPRIPIILTFALFFNAHTCYLISENFSASQPFMA